MLELQNALMEFLQQLGALEIAALLAAVALLLIWLVVRVTRRKSEQAVSVGQRNEFSERAPAPASEVFVNKPVETSVTNRAAVAREATSSAVSAIPEDSVLRRHYLANLEAQRSAATEPHPSDSLLHRHHDVAHTLPLNGEPDAPAAVAVIKVGQANAGDQAKLPQDSVLKRHFIAQLQAEIEAYIAPRPSDSVLLRHYQGVVAAELEKRLSAFNGCE